MKKIVLLLVLLFTVNSFGIVLKKINLPEDWKIEAVEDQKDILVNEIQVPKYIKQTISTPNGNLTLHYYLCGSDEITTKLFNSFFAKKQAAFKADKIVYLIDGNENDTKNVLRFAQLPMTEQVKVIFPDIAKIQGTELTSETQISASDIKAAGDKFGIKIKSGIAQIYTITNSKAKLSIKYYYCKDKNEQIIGFKNARMNNRNDLISYIAAENFLTELEWIK